MNAIKLAFRLLVRDWRAGELRVLAAALVLAVASVGSVSFFADRVKGGLAQQANLLQQHGAVDGVERRGTHPD